jgi:hypothetical protein
MAKKGKGSFRADGRSSSQTKGESQGGPALG